MKLRPHHLLYKICGCCERFDLCRNTREGWIDVKDK